MTLRQEPLRSKKYRDASRGQPCTLRIPYCCDGGGETTVFAHIRDRHTGRAQKASDTSGCDACGPCHDRFDGRDGLLTGPDWYFHALRGLQETYENRVRRGIPFSIDTPKPFSARPTPKRKPKADRKPVAPSRPLQSGPMRQERRDNTKHIDREDA